jgi:hypothetical protein
MLQIALDIKCVTGGFLATNFNKFWGRVGKNRFRGLLQIAFAFGRRQKHDIATLAFNLAAVKEKKIQVMFSIIPTFNWN